MTELDDEREEFEPQASPDEEAGDPAAAFDALRRTIETQGAQIGAEMTVMRRGLEAAFDQLDKIGPPQDYKPELAQLVQQLAAVAERLHGVEQSPILRQGAEHYAARLERAGEGLVKTAAQKLERQTADLERAGRNLSAYVASARERERQNFHRRNARRRVGNVVPAACIAVLGCATCREPRHGRNSVERRYEAHGVRQLDLLGSGGGGRSAY